ncbi:glycoside hydrolase family 6 protein [Pseudonocardia sp.]|uniref:glycoside hydrolase family 6 protein n=1 Tax=Pseudonocardia sp. TaxID=60912 RepID=UPI0026337039|nr:glycoside hydrolase family 6 protein [Pseudonocardia sp.]MCW2722485.1 putative secreted endoglucanase [Pseudonocardia sp.]
MRPRRPTALLLGATVGVAVAIVAAPAFSGLADVSPPMPPTALTGPLPSPSGFFVDPQSPAARQQRQWAAEGRTDDARRIAEIAAQPVPDWLTQPTRAVGADVRSYLGRAAAAKQRPLLVPYFVPGRDCGSYSSGGAADAADYRAWIREVGAALNGVAATVVLEPDAVPQEVSGCGGVDGWAELLAEAVAVLKAAGPVVVYVDAGNPGSSPTPPPSPTR